MIQRLQDGGWIRLRRGSIKRSNTSDGCVSSTVSVAIMLGGFFFLSTLQLFPGVTFLVVTGLVLLWVLAFGALRELMLSAAVTVFVSRHPTRAGESFTVRYRIGRPERVDGVVVSWQGREVTIFRAYNDSTFVEPFLVRTLDASAAESAIEIPADAMPSFSGKNVRIEWAVSVETVRGTTPTKEDFPVLVLPAR